jgi:hypothetical protein
MLTYIKPVSQIPPNYDEYWVLEMIEREVVLRIAAEYCDTQTE